MTPCAARLEVCVDTPARQYHRRQGAVRIPATLCEPCADWLIAWGLPLEADVEQPEWCKRAARHELPAKELAGAA